MTTTRTTTITAIERRLDNQRPDRSAWSRGVKQYTYELLSEVAEALEYQGKGEECPTDWASLRELALNGADDWSAYSWGGSSLIYDFDIANRLCNQTELKRTRGGELRPNCREQWLDTQARALYQAFDRLCVAAQNAYQDEQEAAQR